MQFLNELQSCLGNTSTINIERKLPISMLSQKTDCTHESEETF